MDVPKKIILFLITFSAIAGAIFFIFFINFFINRDGTLLVDITSPDTKGAIVYANNRLACYAPCITNLRQGKYQIRVEKENYNSYEKEIEIKKGKTTEINVQLIMEEEENLNKPNPAQEKMEGHGGKNKK